MNYKPILAVDFDGTLVTPEYPSIGRINQGVFKTMWEAKALGWEIIIWTCREGQYLQDAIDLLNTAGVPYDYVNNHSKQALDFFDYESRKIYATLYHDDRNVHHATWNELYERLRESSFS
jgi:hypothetical protein